MKNVTALVLALRYELWVLTPVNNAEGQSQSQSSALVTRSRDSVIVSLYVTGTETDWSVQWVSNGTTRHHSVACQRSEPELSRRPHLRPAKVISRPSMKVSVKVTTWRCCLLPRPLFYPANSDGLAGWPAGPARDLGSNTLKVLT